MKPEAIKADVRRDMAFDALSGVSIPDIMMKYMDQGVESTEQINEEVMAVFHKAAPEIMRAYPESRTNLSQFLVRLRKDTRRQLVLAIKTKTRGTK
jgi:hypothetical protein